MNTRSLKSGLDVVHVVSLTKSLRTVIFVVNLPVQQILITKGITQLTTRTVPV
jgi:hypothetical protein